MCKTKYSVICCTIINTDLRVIMNDVNIITFWVYLTLERDATFKCQFDFGLYKCSCKRSSDIEILRTYLS